MFALFWKHFPVFYTLSFLLATIRIEHAANVGEVMRWVVLAVGCAITANFGFRRGKRRPGVLTHFDLIIVTFLVIFLASAAWSIQPLYSAQRAVSLMLLYGCSFWALWRYADQFSEELLICKFLRTLGLVLAVNLVAGTLLFPDELFARRFQGLFENPNNIGLIGGLALPLAAARWLRTRQRLDLAVTGTLALSLVAAGTRSALLGVAVAMTAILISFMVKRPGRALLFSLIALISAGLFSQTEFFTEHLLREDTLETGSNRTVIWELAKGYIEERPSLGHGFGTDAMINEYYGVVLWDLGLRGYGVMSSYYGLAVQIGWPLTYVFFGLLWAFVVRCLVKYWRRDYALVTMAATLTSGLIICVFEPAIYSAGNVFAFQFWMVFMLAARRVRYRRARVQIDSHGALLRPAQSYRLRQKDFGEVVIKSTPT
jgi:O-antigen ligase